MTTKTEEMEIKISQGELAKIINNVKLEMVEELDNYLIDCEPSKEKDCVVVESEHLLDAIRKFQPSHKSITILIAIMIISLTI